MKNLNIKAFGGLLGLLVTMAALLFLPALILDYWQAWIFLTVFFLSAFAITLYLMKKDPKLLERRVYAGASAEKETSQKIIQVFAGLFFCLLLVVPALDHRFHWSDVPIHFVLQPIRKVLMLCMLSMRMQIVTMQDNYQSFSPI
jgi:predicted tellurium resistance membrane protein TerC